MIRPIPPTLERVSWSQVEKFLLCQLRWWYSWYRPDIQEPSSPSLEIGTACHSVLEAHYETRGGVFPLPDRLLQEDALHARDSMLKLLKDPRLPPVDADVRTEYPRDYELGLTLGGVRFRGRADVLWAHSPTHLSIWDLKTTSKWKNAQSPDDLPRNGQLAGYGKAFFNRWPKLETVSFHHAQVLTSACDSQVIGTQPLTRQDVDDAVAPVEATIVRMRDVYAKPQAEVATNPKACWKWGRPCPYLSICPVGSGARPGIDDVIEDTEPLTQEAQEQLSMDLKEKLAKKRAATAPAPTEVVRAVGINPPDAALPEPVAKYVPPVAAATAPPAAGVRTYTGLVEDARLILLVDSAPQKGLGPVTYLEEEISRRTPMLLAELRQSHPRDVPSNAVDLREVAFGNGTTALVANFKRDPPKGVVVASLHDRLSGEVVGVLTPLADVVIRPR